MIVADANLISHLLIPSNFSAEAERVRAADTEWIAPLLWAGEFRNVLRNYMRAGIIKLDLSLRYAQAAEELMSGRAYPVSSSEVLTLAAISGCTTYDCEYVALAKAADLLLVTTDKEILKAFPALAVHPQQFGR